MPLGRLLVEKQQHEKREKSNNLFLSHQQNPADETGQRTNENNKIAPGTINDAQVFKFCTELS